MKIQSNSLQNLSDAFKIKFLVRFEFQPIDRHDSAGLDLSVFDSKPFDANRSYSSQEINFWYNSVTTLRFDLLVSLSGIL